MKFLFTVFFSLISFLLFSQIIVVSKDTTINDTWNIKPGTTLRFEGGKIKGRGKVNGGIIQAGLRQWIFDTTLTVNPEGVYAHDFSAMWFGANGGNADNFNQLQAAINVCLRNSLAIKNCFIPQGTFRYSKPLFISQIYNDKYVGCTIHLYGEGNFWDATYGTTLLYTSTDGFALGVQVGKGVEIDHIAVRGQFKSLEGPDSVYYKTTFNNFKDANGKCTDKQFGPYAGIVIDPFNKGRVPPDKGYNIMARNYLDGGNDISGSTGVKVHDLYVGNFVVNICVSPNGITRNAEILLFENIHIGDGKVGISGGEDQEKYNLVKGIYCWSRLHTLFVTGKYGNATPGNWYIDGGNIAGKVIRLIENQQSGWYPTHISNLFCESLGTIGAIYSALPVSVSNSTFHFAFPKNVGYLTLLDAGNEGVKFDNCIFRYYNGGNEIMNFSGNPTFENCLFSGTPTMPQTSGAKPIFINCHVGGAKLGFAETAK